VKNGIFSAAAMAASFLTQKTPVPDSPEAVLTVNISVLESEKTSKR
jgi:hypothetical protein